MGLRESLLKGEATLAVFGAGYIGYSCSAFFARRGVKSLLIDLDKDKVEKINKGEPPYPEVKTWLGFDVKPHTDLGLLRATTDWEETLSEEYTIHIIGVNTDKDGLPWDGALKDVCTKIAKAKARPLLTIIESTLMPKWTDEVVIPIFEGSGLRVGEDVLIAVAPRRDWFTLPGQSCEILDRVVGGTTPEATTRAVDVLSIISEKIHPTDYRTAELVKAVENAHRHLCIQLACQLSLAYPNEDVREVLRLAATKWNMDLYYPSIGSGGYCIPVAPNYVLKGAERAEALSLLTASLEVDRSVPYEIARHLVKDKQFKRFGILGLAYKGNLKVHVLSPSVKLAQALYDSGAQLVKFHDPLYSKEETQKISKCDTFAFPDELGTFDCIIVACDHDLYKAIPKTELLKHIEGCKYILDCHDVWGHSRELFQERRIEYHLTGDRGWL